MVANQAIRLLVCSWFCSNVMPNQINFFSFFFAEHSAKSNQIFFHFSLQNMMPNQIKFSPFSHNEAAPTSAPSIGCLLLLNYGLNLK
jgi:hypothetical protein